MAQAPNQLRPEISERHKFGAELRAARLGRGMSQAALADLIHVHRDLVAKVERAVRKPSERFAASCDSVLGTAGTLTALWARVVEEQQEFAAAPDAVARDMLDHCLRLLAVLGSTANAVGLHSLGAVVAGELDMLAHYRDAAKGLTRQLCGVRGRWLEFASWVADNEGRSADAAELLEQASSLAEEADDPGLAGYLLMRRAQRAIEHGNSEWATALASPSARCGRLPPRTQALCLVRTAQAHAMVGDAISVHKSLTRAQQLLDRGDHQEADAALAGHCTPAYIHAHEAHCALLLGDSRAAVSAYRAVLGEWPDAQRLDEGLFRAHLAVALDHAGMADEADAEGRQALRLGVQTGSRRTIATLGSATSRGSTRPIPAPFRDAQLLIESAS